MSFEVFHESHRLRANRPTRAEKHGKNTKIDSLERPKSSQDHLNHSSEPLGNDFEQKKLSENAPERPKSSKDRPEIQQRGFKRAQRGLRGGPRGDPVGTPWAGSVQWRRPAEEGGGGKPPLELVQEIAAIQHAAMVRRI